MVASPSWVLGHTAWNPVPSSESLPIVHGPDGNCLLFEAHIYFQNPYFLVPSYTSVEAVIAVYPSVLSH